MKMPGFEVIALDILGDESERVPALALALEAAWKAGLADAAKLVRGLHGAHGLIFQEAAAVCIEKLAE